MSTYVYVLHLGESHRHHVDGIFSSLEEALRYFQEIREEYDFRCGSDEYVAFICQRVGEPFQYANALAGIPEGKHSFVWFPSATGDGPPSLQLHPLEKCTRDWQRANKCYVY